MLNDLRIFLKLVEKQSKEIEKLNKSDASKEQSSMNYYNLWKEEKEKNKKLQDKAKELIFEKQELTSALLDSTPNDKIKAKIEEVQDGTYDAKIVLQSLLEKE